MLPIAEAQDAIVMAAAVADFTPAAPADRKIKKDPDASVAPTLDLAPTHDFLVDLDAANRSVEVLVGFAAETDDLRANAPRQVGAQRLDLIVGNDVSTPGTGFAHDTNAVVILDADGNEALVPLATKRGGRGGAGRRGGSTGPDPDQSSQVSCRSGAVGGRWRGPLG
ncbi:MAG: phosphopantothenoylcysteine decarboxylase [Acidimicrobiales bacterium]